MSENKNNGIIPDEKLAQVTGGIEPKNRDITMVFQNYTLYPHLTVFDNMNFSSREETDPKLP